MTQPSKVFHLYVEVRSLGDQGKMPENTEDTNSLMLSRPDIHSQSQRATLNAPQSLLHLPRDVHKEPITHTFASSKSPPRHSVSCQFSPGEAIVQPPGQHRRSLPYDEISQLLCALQSGPDEGTQSLVRTQLFESEPLNRRDSRFSGHFTAPPTPSGSRRTHGCEEEGKRSAVTYHYIEKANIKIVQGQHSGLCQSEPGNPFRRAGNDEDIPIQLSNMLSEPVEFNSLESSDTISIKHSLPGSIRTPTNTPNLHRAMMESIAREATSRALAEFGSPQLKRRWAANIRDRDHDYPRCNSWSGSPVVPRSGRTSLSNAQLTYQDQHQSQATDQLSTHVRQLNSTVSSPTNSQSEGIPGHQETPNQHMSKGEESPRQLYRHGPFSPTIMPPAIQREVPPMTITQAVCNQRFDQRTSKSPRQTHKVNFNFASTSNLSDGGAGKQSLSKSASPAISPELAHKLAEEATKLSRLIEAKRFNSPSPSQLDTAIPQRESHHHASIQSYSAKIVSDSHFPAEGHHGEQEPVETGHLSGQATFHRAILSPVRPARLHLCSIGPTSGMSSCELSKRRIGSEAVLGSQENHLREIGGEDLIEAEQSCVLSQSSSGVTGSLQESTRPEADCNSPESSSQTSQRSSVKENTGIQLDSGSQLLGPSLHSQKIAHAKWEFLFGKPSGDLSGVKEVPGSSSATSSGYSSEFPTPSPPSSLPPRPTAATSIHRPSSEYQRSSSHEVQEVEVELLSPVPSSVLGSSPTTGIIRRAIRYSETDLDAVPLRCYRETDIDEVLLAEQEEDSAFSSSRSVPVTSGTSGTSSCSTLETTGWLQADGAEEGEELPKDEEVASWASVRMQCDRKRQHATHDRDEMFSRLLKCCPSSPTALKSPVSVESPSTTSLDGLDSFSRHFESIMESHRAKGTSYSSLDSEDLTLCGPSVFTFDLPTLTPEIQSQICESTKQIIELSFAPLAQSEAAGLSGSTASEAPQGSAKTRLRGSAKEERESSPPQNHLQRYADSETSQRERSSRSTSFTDPDVTVANGNKGDLQATKRLAMRLYNLDGFRRSDIMRHLSKNNEFSQMVAEEYLSHFNFSCLSLDQSLRVFLREFALVGETQERERVLSHFSRRYLQCNPNTIPNEDSVHTLTCALMLLNTDLHGNNVGKRMSCRQFISNLEGLNGGQDFPKVLLKALYNSIKNEKLQWTIDEEEPRKSFSDLTTSRTDSASHTLKRSGSGAGPLNSLAQQANAQVYKSGFLMRKVHASPGGKKTPRGRRGWKSFYAILKGLVLYLQKGEFRADKQLSDEDLKNAVSIHHSLAMRAADYSKRPNVFYLRTADWRVFLFQAPNAEQMQSWITRINMVAAIFSAPPFPAAIGSQKKFSRPLLPGSSTKLSEEEQVQSHEMRFRTVSSELQDLRSIPQELKPRGKELEEYKQREEYLDFEKMRYGTYAMLLRAKIRSGETDLTAFEGWMFAEGGLQRALSSPTLTQDSSGGGSSVSKKGFKHSFRQAVKP